MPSMNVRLDPRMVAASIHGPAAGGGEPSREHHLVGQRAAAHVAEGVQVASDTGGDDGAPLVPVGPAGADSGGGGGLGIQTQA